MFLDESNTIWTLHQGAKAQYEDQKLSCAASKTHTDRNGPQKNISIHVAAKRCFGASACEAKWIGEVYSD